MRSTIGSIVLSTIVRDHVKSTMASDAENGARPKEKKPFDKRLYRLKKYSNKYKIDKWEERRKKAVLRNFYKELNKDGEDVDKVKDIVRKNKEKEYEKLNPYQLAKQEYQRKKEEAQARKQKKLEKEKEIKEALERYKKNKAEKFKKISKKTKRGQPVMKGRLEVLLEKIKQGC